MGILNIMIPAIMIRLPIKIRPLGLSFRNIHKKAGTAILHRGQNKCYVSQRHDT